MLPAASARPWRGSSWRRARVALADIDEVRLDRSVAELAARIVAGVQHGAYHIMTHRAGSNNVKALFRERLAAFDKVDGRFETFSVPLILFVNADLPTAHYGPVGVDSLIYILIKSGQTSATKLRAGGES